MAQAEVIMLSKGMDHYDASKAPMLSLYNEYYGGSMASIVFQTIRESKALAYAVFSELSPYRDTGCLSISAGTSVESARKVVDSIVKEFRQLKEQAVAPDELRRAKDHLKGSLMLSLESTSSRMSNLARQQMYFGRFFTLDELVESIDGVTDEDVRQIAVFGHGKWHAG